MHSDSAQLEPGSGDSEHTPTPSRPLFTLSPFTMSVVPQASKQQYWPWVSPKDCDTLSVQTLLAHLWDMVSYLQSVCLWA